MFDHCPQSTLTQATHNQTMGNRAPVNFKTEAKALVNNFTQNQIDTHQVGATEQLVFMPAYKIKQDAKSHLQETGSDVGLDPTTSATAVTTNEMEVLRATLDSLPATLPMPRMKSHQAYSKLNRLGYQIMRSWCKSNTVFCAKQRQQASGPQ